VTVKQAAATQPSDPALIRNVVVVGPAGSGKTSLIEHLLAQSGAIDRPGSVADGSTVCDRDPAAISHQRSVGLAVASIAWESVAVNLIDTPGYADFIGEVRAGMRAADAALFVVSAIDGIDASTQQLWNECELLRLPRAVVVTNLDRERADFDETVSICHRVFTGGGGVLPLVLPIHGDARPNRPGASDVVGFIDLLTTRIHEWTSGSEQEQDSDPEHQELINRARTELIEGIITESEDETLMDRFVDGEAIDVTTLTADLERAVARGHFHPVLAHVSGADAVGSRYVLSTIVRAFPSPLERDVPLVTSPGGEPRPPLTADPDGPLCAEVIKTTSDPYVGRISIVRVFSGSIGADDRIHVTGHFAAGRGREDHELDERVGQVSSPLGDVLRPVSGAVAGSIVAVSRLEHAETGDTLSSVSAPLLMEPWAMPEPLLPIAMVAHSSGDEDKLGSALARLLAEDPTLRLVHDEASGQMIVWCLGEAHGALVVDRLRSRFGVEVDPQELRMTLRETFAAGSSGTGRVVKQSGGHGQYAVCEIEVEPLPIGSGFEFVDRVVGGAIPRSLIPSVERGIRQQLAKGLVAGYPVVDIRVALTDGKSHSVDSSDIAFQTAGALALKDAAVKAGVSLLEPMVTLIIEVPDEHVGAVLSDLAHRRAQVTGTESTPTGQSLITAVAPEAEVSRYAIDIRSVTHGTGRFTRQPAGMSPMPPAAARRILGN
jgi:elongation factor G